jgi:hypothetical protein
MEQDIAIEGCGNILRFHQNPKTAVFTVQIRGIYVFVDKIFMLRN